jgi:predicted nucleic acid-binding protein
VTNRRIFLDASVLFAAVLSETGGSRQLLKLGEAGVIAFWIGPSVLAEMDAVSTRKSPGSKSGLAILLDRARIHIGPQTLPFLVGTPGDCLAWLRAQLF